MEELSLFDFPKFKINKKIRLKEIGKEDSDDTYNDFYNGAEHEGYSVEMVIPLDEKLSKKYNMAIPNGHECWYELKKSRRQK